VSAVGALSRLNTAGGGFAADAEKQMMDAPPRAVSDRKEAANLGAK